MSKSLKMGTCRLCKRDAELQDSHIIPKFVIRWLKETGTGYFRRIAAPNVRLQDGTKQQLLCGNCEQLFSVRETRFAAQVFRPMLSGAKSIAYDQWLVYFAVSLLWRALCRNLEEASASSYRFIAEVEEAEAEWRKFLLGEGQLSRFSHVHIFVADIALENPPGIPKFNLYCARACDATFFDLENRCYVVVKFARFFIVGMLTPYPESEWKKTRIDTNSGILSVPQEIRDLAFGGWLMARAKFAYEQFDSTVSHNQLRVIRNHITKELPRLQNSDLFQVAAADQSDHQRVLSKSRNVGRNDRCPCGSGLKFKKCHGRPL